AASPTPRSSSARSMCSASSCRSSCPKPPANPCRIKDKTVMARARGPGSNGRTRMTPADFMREYEAAANRHDLQAMLAMIADDAIFWFSDQSAHVGKLAIASAIQSNFDAIKNEQYRIENLNWLAASDDIAACVYEFRWSGEVNGKPASGG